MPSIAGAIIVLWLASNSDESFRSVLMLPSSSENLTLPSLVLLFLYGNLFCYIASYPVLTFHVTRVLDFKNDDAKWPFKKNFLLQFTDSYILTLILALASFISFKFFVESTLFPFITVILFALMQIIRILISINYLGKFKGIKGKVSYLYAFTHSLSKRRSISEIVIQENNSGNKKKNTTKKTYWRPEYIETYRHLREHGNSAFIFVLEIILASLIYQVLTSDTTNTSHLENIGGLVFIWSLPALFIHLAGQHLERRFSHFERRTNNNGT